MSNDSTTASFKYNSDGLRVQKTVGSVVTNYTLHGKNIVHMTQGSNSLHFFYDASNKPAIVDFNGTKYAYVHNLQGDIVSIVDSTGSVVVQYKYDAWGRIISKAGSLASTLGTLNPFRYRSYVFDEETGLYYLQTRYYSNVLCRFCNSDDEALLLETSTSPNLYQYCNNDPVHLFDKNGENAEFAIKLSSSAFASFSAWLTSLTAATWWNPFCWIIAGVILAGVVTWAALELYDKYLAEQIVQEQRKQGENWDKTVKEILKTRQGRILRAPIPPGGPSWEEAMALTLGEIFRRMQTDPKWHEIYKLLTDNRFKK